MRKHKRAIAKYVMTAAGFQHLNRPALSFVTGARTDPSPFAEHWRKYCTAEAVEKIIDKRRGRYPRKRTK